GAPLALPGPESFSLIGYQKVFADSAVPLYYFNSVSVTVTTIFITLLIGAMAAWALTEYRFRWNTLLGLYLAVGIMVPIRLGSVSILKLVADMNLVNTRTALILVYTAQSLPLAIFILSEFIAQIPKDLREAARCDGVSEYTIFFRIVLPLIRPAMATVAVFTMIPIWNDLWFPLLLAPGGGKQTITLGIQQFIGQYVTDWNAVLAALSVAIVPVLILYALFSRQLIRGLTSGAVK
ncbi:MAG: carbohydrate ABC transporter permease, partial [Parvibaculaceae bacterium]